MFFTRQGFLRLHYYTGKEPWTHRLFDIRGGQVQAQTQLYGWLNLYGNVNFSRSIYYDRVQPFPGHEVYLNLGLVLQPDSRLNENISFTRDVFDRLSGGPHVFAVNILNTRTSYQINKRLSARAIARYDSSRARVLTDFLGSYELVPGTVAYAGYGSLFERTSWDGEQLVRGPGEYLNTQRGLFFKVSYLHRF
jgi:hypothetical protein